MPPKPYIQFNPKTNTVFEPDLKSEKTTVYDYEPVLENLTEEIITTGNLETLQTFWDEKKETLNDQEKGYMQSRISAAMEIEKARNKSLENLAKGQNPPVPEPDNVDGYKGFSNIHSENYQTSGSGCWSVAYSNLLRSRGVDLSQETIRGWRPDHKKDPSTPQEKINQERTRHSAAMRMNQDTVNNIMDMADIMTEVLPNTAMSSIKIDPLVKEIFQIDGKVPSEGDMKKIHDFHDATANKYLKDTIMQALVNDKSPVAMLVDGHYMTITGISENRSVFRVEDSVQAKPEDRTRYMSIDEIIQKAFYPHENAEGKTVEPKGIELQWLHSLQPIEHDSKSNNIDIANVSEHDKNFVNIDVSTGEVKVDVPMSHRTAGLYGNKGNGQYLGSGVSDMTTLNMDELSQYVGKKVTAQIGINGASIFSNADTYYPNKIMFPGDPQLQKYITNPTTTVQTEQTTTIQTDTNLNIPLNFIQNSDATQKGLETILNSMNNQNQLHQFSDEFKGSLLAMDDKMELIKGKDNKTAEDTLNADFNTLIEEIKKDPYISNSINDPDWEKNYRNGFKSNPEKFAMNVIHSMVNHFGLQEQVKINNKPIDPVNPAALGLVNPNPQPTIVVNSDTTQIVNNINLANHSSNIINNTNLNTDSNIQPNLNTDSNIQPQPQNIVQNPTQQMNANGPLYPPLPVREVGFNNGFVDHLKEVRQKVDEAKNNNIPLNQLEAHMGPQVRRLKEYINTNLTFKNELGPNWEQNFDSQYAQNPLGTVNGMINTISTKYFLQNAVPVSGTERFVNQPAPVQTQPNTTQTQPNTTQTQPDTTQTQPDTNPNNPLRDPNNIDIDAKIKQNWDAMNWKGEEAGDDLDDDELDIDNDTRRLSVDITDEDAVHDNQEMDVEVRSTMLAEIISLVELKARKVKRGEENPKVSVDEMTTHVQKIKDDPAFRRLFETGKDKQIIENKSLYDLRRGLRECVDEIKNEKKYDQGARKDLIQKRSRYLAKKLEDTKTGSYDKKGWISRKKNTTEFDSVLAAIKDTGNGNISNRGLKESVEIVKKYLSGKEGERSRGFGRERWDLCMTYLKEVMPRNEFEAYCKEINKARKVENKPSDDLFVSPEMFGYPKEPVTSMMNELKNRIRKGQGTERDFATAIAIRKLCDENGRFKLNTNVDSKEARRRITRETEKIMRQDNFKRFMSDVPANERLEMLKGNCNKLLKYEQRVRQANMEIDTGTIHRSNIMVARENRPRQRLSI
ncbi:MAG: hypothetical protein K6E28_01625 [Eubacterium sp.]|nr:hypothetical protein [Eubacterium sp.]